MENPPRLIITIDVLKDIFKGESKKLFLDELIRIYSHEYNMARNLLTARSLEIIGVNQKAASVWIDMRNALDKMSSLERERLREQCDADLETQVRAMRFSRNYNSIREIIEMCISTQQAGTTIHSLVNNIDVTIRAYIASKFKRFEDINGDSEALKDLLEDIVKTRMG